MSPTRSPIARVVLGLACAAAVVSYASAAGSGSPQPTREERHRALGIIGRTAPVPDPRQSQGTPSQDDFDVTHYFISIAFDDVQRTISGNVTITAESTIDGLQHVELNLRDNLTVNTVTSSLVPLAFTHQNDLLGVTLPAVRNRGESFTFTVSYGGGPTTGGSLGTFGWNKYQTPSQGQMVWSLSEPEGARNWWPCKDRPDDKALVEEQWTVRGDWIATGNGRLISVSDLPGNRKRYRWRSDHPLTTYLVSVAATNYVTFSHQYTPLEGGSMPIDYYVYPEDLADAQVSFSNTAAMLGAFAELFGEYPFVEEKYGMSAFPFGGAMEHSTNTSYGYIAIEGTHTFDFLNAHEIAHQWWGDSVSPETWNDIWLNEGFASYGEALWFERTAGASAYHTYVNTQFHHDFFSGSVYAPNQLFGSTVYDKGAMVLHMLRRVMGDEAFFDGLRQWYASRADGVGNTAQFIENQEQEHGAELDWFFDQWVYGTGMPEYEVGFTTAEAGPGLYRNYVRVVQVQGVPAVFTMPAELAFVADPLVHRVTVWNDAEVQDFVVETSFPPAVLRFDEDAWILKSDVTQVPLADGDADGVPDGIDNCEAVANPAQGNVDLDDAGDACDEDDDGDSIPDAADCAPLDAEQGEPEEVGSLQIVLDQLSWTAAPRADQYDVARGALGDLAIGLTTCFATAVPGLSYTDSSVPAPGQGFAYLVRGVDAGCGGPGPAGFDSSGNPRSFPCP